MAPRSEPENVRVVTTNRKAYHDYSIEETYEAGIVLRGSEIKSIRAGRVNLRDGYAQIRNGELWLIDVHISPYSQASTHEGYDPSRPRKLLMHRYQINRLARDQKKKGYTIVPLRMYLKGKWAKVELGLGKGRRLYDKRRAIAERESQRRMERALAKQQRRRR
ncbi:MAG: SsrA-binding protein SmpB [Chloroflexota bacterium]|nr:SsrA-binding protein SmpB [Chloroflexota bacterium]